MYRSGGLPIVLPYAMYNSVPSILVHQRPTPTAELLVQLQLSRFNIAHIYSRIFAWLELELSCCVRCSFARKVIVKGDLAVLYLRCISLYCRSWSPGQRLRKSKLSSVLKNLAKWTENSDCIYDHDEFEGEGKENRHSITMYRIQRPAVWTLAGNSDFRVSTWMQNRSITLVGHSQSSTGWDLRSTNRGSYTMNDLPEDGGLDVDRLMYLYQLYERKFF